MTIAKELESSQAIIPNDIVSPSGIYSDEPPLESELHLEQIMLLLKCLKWLWRDQTDFYAAGNLTIYYSSQQSKTNNSRGPDFFVVLDTERKVRKSWVVWEENDQYPNVILEILSPSTANNDKGEKKEIYQDIFRTPDYFWFDPYTLEFAGFHLVDGKYQPLEPNPKGHLWSQQLGLYLGIHHRMLRFFTSVGKLVPTPEETAEQESQRAQQESQRAQQESQRAEQASQRAEQASQRAERLAAKLRELNIDPDTI